MSDTTAQSADQLEADLREQFGDGVGERRQRHEMPELQVEPSALLAICRRLKDHHGLNHLELLGGIDRLDHLDVIYLLDSMPTPPAFQRLVLRVGVPRDDAHLPSVAGVWAAANWHERECYDLLGVVFDGHPDLRRIVLPDIWEGYPLRKDYAYTTSTMVDEILTDELGTDERERL